MADEVHLWRIGPDEQLIEISRASLDLESRLQEWLARDISILDPDLLVIGQEVETDFGGFIDILCIDAAGDLVIVELKRDKTPREITAQALDYASWVANLSNERVTSIANDHLDDGFDSAFTQRFGIDVPETLNADHRTLVVGSEIDPSSGTHRSVSVRCPRREHQRGDVPVLPPSRVRAVSACLPHRTIRGRAEDANEGLFEAALQSELLRLVKKTGAAGDSAREEEAPPAPLIRLVTPLRRAPREEASAL